MQVCNYCKRVLKEEYETCPGCGASDFSNKAYLGEMVIKKVPEGGYKLKLINYKNSLWIGNAAIIVSLLVWFMLQTYFFPLVLPPLLAGLMFLVPSIVFRNKASKNIKRLKELSNKGILVKAMPYNVVKINQHLISSKKEKKCIEVIYDNSAGVGIPLYSEVKYDIDNESKKYKTVDLLIDPEDYSNFYIDYEIY